MLTEHLVFVIITVLLLVSEVLGILSLRQNWKHIRIRLFYLAGIEVWLWLFFNLLELLATSEAWTVIFMKISFIPVMALAPTLVWMGYTFIGNNNSKKILWVFVPFGVLMAFMLTNDLHYWFWKQYHFTQYGTFLAIHNTYGFLFYIFTIGSYLAIIFGIGLLIFNLVNIAKYYRRRTIPSIIVLSLTILWSAAYVMRLIPLQKDFSPVVYNFVFVLLLYAAIRQRLFRVNLVPRQKLFNFINDGIIIFDKEATILDINKSAMGVLGLSESCVGNPLEDVLPFWRNLNLSLPEEEPETIEVFPSTIVSIGDSSNLNYLDVDIKYIDYGFVMMLHDVTELQKLMITIEEMANFDSLTQLRNRRSFFNMVEGLIASAKRNKQPITIMLMDIDNFKQINDQFGHSTGDRVLKQLASFLSTALRAVDVKARYGGDEFIVLLPQTNLRAANIVATRLFEGMQTAVRDMDVPGLEVSVSIGLSGRDVLDRSQSLMEIVEEADQALYAVKSRGKGFAMNFLEMSS